jgi:hypothetical protein
MRALMALVAGIAVAGLLFQAGPRQAFACSCGPLPDSPERARQYLEPDYVDALVVAVVEERLNPGEVPYPEARVKVERSYKGALPSEITVRSANCNGIIVDFKKGQRWLMDLSRQEFGWQAHGCSAGIVDGAISRQPYNDGDVWLAVLEEIAPATSPDAPSALVERVEADRDDGPPAVAVVATLAGIGMVMLASVYVGRRRARG